MFYFSYDSCLKTWAVPQHTCNLLSSQTWQHVWVPYWDAGLLFPFQYHHSSQSLALLHLQQCCGELYCGSITNSLLLIWSVTGSPSLVMHLMWIHTVLTLEVQCHVFQTCKRYLWFDTFAKRLWYQKFVYWHAKVIKDTARPCIANDDDYWWLCWWWRLLCS